MRKLDYHLGRTKLIHNVGYRPFLENSDYIPIFSRQRDKCTFKKCNARAFVFPVLFFYYKGDKEDNPCGKLPLDMPLCYVCNRLVKLKDVMERTDGWFEILKPWREDTRTKGIPDPKSTRVLFYHLKELKEGEKRLTLEESIQVMMDLRRRI